jgi:hypothetical protein
MTIDEQLTHDKDVEFYAALAAGWVDTRMEFDRTLIALSGAGIGLFATLLTTVGVNSRWEAISYGVGSLGFIGAITAGLWIFLRNADFFQKLVKGGGLEGDPVLKRLDRALVICFACGALGALAAGTLASISKHQQTEQSVSNDAGKAGGSKPSTNPPTAPRSDSIRRVVPDFTNIKTGSVDGIQKMKPTSTTPATTPTAPPAPAKKEP